MKRFWNTQVRVKHVVFVLAFGAVATFAYNVYTVAHAALAHTFELLQVLQQFSRQ
jgi:hypothetical protein